MSLKPFIARFGRAARTAGDALDAAQAAQGSPPAEDPPAEDDADDDEEAAAAAAAEDPPAEGAADAAGDEAASGAAAAAPPAGANAVRADAAAIAGLCAAAGVPELAAGLIAAGLHPADARARIENAGEIKRLVGLARQHNPTIGAGLADEFIRNGASAAEAGRVLIEKLAAGQSPEIRNGHTPGSRPAGARNDHGWDAVIAKTTGRKEG